jgi:two-component system, cell cycle sensor histidine kinase and response regulator CckA
MTRVQQSDESFRLVVEAAPYAMVMVNQEGKILLVNAQTEKLFGYSRKELLGQAVEILAPEAFRDLDSGLRRDLTKEPREAGREARARRKDGSQFPVEIRLNPIQTEEETWVLSSIADLSERKRVESELRESEERFRNMADTAPVMIWVSGPDQLCTFVNKGWLEFTGRSLEQGLGKGWTDRIHPEDFGCLATYETSFSARRTFQMEYRLRRHDGEYRWVLDTGVPRFEPNGVFAGYVGSAMDITDFKRAQDVAYGRQKLESLGLLASGLAHDFNNMQSGIIALSEILLDSSSLDPNVAEEVRKIKRMALHGSEIVHELMVYAGQDDAEIAPVDVSALIEEIRELLKVSISKGIELKTHLGRGLPPLLASATHIRQIVINLIVNASEAIGERDGVIEVSSSHLKASGRHILSHGGSLPDGDYLRLGVSDTGCGMTKEIRRKIFDPFFTTKVSGRGLGLAVVQGIVRRYGGVVDIKSAPGKGTRFEILIPFAREQASQMAEA